MRQERGGQHHVGGLAFAQQVGQVLAEGLLPGRGQHEPPARAQHRPDVPHGHVEAGRDALDDAAVRADAVARDAVGDEVGQPPVRDQDALGHAGRSGGVDHVRRVVGVQRRGPLGVGQRAARPARHRRGHRGVVQDDRAAGRPGRDRGPGARCAHHDGRSGVPQHERDALGRVFGVHRYVHAARHRHGQHGDGHRHRPFDDDRHPALRPHAVPGQVPGQLTGLVLQLGVGERLVCVLHRDGARRAPGLCAEQLGHRRHRHRRVRTVPFRHDQRALVRVQDTDPAHRHRAVRHELFEDPHQPPDELLGDVRRHLAAAVRHVHAQPLARDDTQGQRVVRGLAGAQDGEGERVR